MAVAEISLDELDAVSGGFLSVVPLIKESAVGWAVGKVLDGAVDWFNSNKGGGADLGTWERIGQGQLGS